MFEINFTFLFTAVNLVILYLFLNKFLFKRLGGFMQERSDAIAANISKGEALIAEGEEYRQKYEQMLENAANERKQIIEDGHKKAVKEYEDKVEEAKKEAERILANAAREAENIHEQMLMELKREITQLSLSAASKVIEENMDNDKNRVLVEKFLKNGEAA